MKSQKGYSLIEIGVGLALIAIFTFCSSALFNGCYNNHRVIQQRNIAISYAIATIEDALQSDLNELGFTADMINRDSILETAKITNQDLLDEGNYAVPEDKVKGPSDDTNNMIITTKIRRLPGTKTQAMDSTVLKISVNVAYKIRVNDEEYRNISLEALKVTKK